MRETLVLPVPQELCEVPKELFDEFSTQAWRFIARTGNQHHYLEINRSGRLASKGNNRGLTLAIGEPVSDIAEYIGLKLLPDTMISISASYVLPGESQRDTGWHRDGTPNTVAITDVLGSEALVGTLDGSTRLQRRLYKAARGSRALPLFFGLNTHTDRNLKRAGLKIIASQPYMATDYGNTVVHRSQVNIGEAMLPRTWLRFSY